MFSCLQEKQDLLTGYGESYKQNFATNTDQFHSSLGSSWAGYGELTERESYVVNWDSFHPVDVEQDAEQFS